MLPASSKKGGRAFAVLDMCWTPAAPSPITVPYVNIGMLNTCDGVIDVVLMENKETVVESSKIPQSQGNEAGTVGGVASGVNMGKITFKQYSSKVYAKGKKVVRHLVLTSHNNDNTVGIHDLPSQTKIIVAL